MCFEIVALEERLKGVGGIFWLDTFNLAYSYFCKITYPAFNVTVATLAPVSPALLPHASFMAQQKPTFQKNL